MLCHNICLYWWTLKCTLVVTWSCITMNTKPHSTMCTNTKTHQLFWQNIHMFFIPLSISCLIDWHSIIHLAWCHKFCPFEPANWKWPLFHASIAQISFTPTWFPNTIILISCACYLPFDNIPYHTWLHASLIDLPSA